MCPAVSDTGDIAVNKTRKKMKVHVFMEPAFQWWEANNKLDDGEFRKDSRTRE